MCDSSVLICTFNTNSFWWQSTFSFFLSSSKLFRAMKTLKMINKTQRINLKINGPVANETQGRSLNVLSVMMLPSALVRMVDREHWHCFLEASSPDRSQCPFL